MKKIILILVMITLSGYSQCMGSFIDSYSDLKDLNSTDEVIVLDLGEDMPTNTLITFTWSKMKGFGHGKLEVSNSNDGINFTSPKIYSTNIMGQQSFYTTSDMVRYIQFKRLNKNIDIYSVGYDYCTLTADEIKDEMFTVAIYPKDKAYDYFIIESMDKITSIIIFEYGTGDFLRTENFNKVNSAYLDISDLDNSKYVLIIQTEKYSITTSIIKESK